MATRRTYKLSPGSKSLATYAAKRAAVPRSERDRLLALADRWESGWHGTVGRGARSPAMARAVRAHIDRLDRLNAFREGHQRRQWQAIVDQTAYVQTELISLKGVAE